MVTVNCCPVYGTDKMGETGFYQQTDIIADISLKSDPCYAAYIYISYSHCFTQRLGFSAMFKYHPVSSQKVQAQSGIN